MDSLALVFSSGWASGINAYLVVLVLGVADRVNDFAQIPDVLGRWEVLTVAFVMYAMEFVADKIPYIDSTWDAISTAIRPTVGAVLGVLLAGEADSLGGAVAAVVGGGTALASHAVKMGSRLALNSSPEPVSNIAASVAEDVAVLGVVWFAIEHPVAAASIAAVLLVAGLAMLYVLVKVVRRGLRRWRTARRPTDVRLRLPRHRTHERPGEPRGVHRAVLAFVSRSPPPSARRPSRPTWPDRWPPGHRPLRRARRTAAICGPGIEIPVIPSSSSAFDSASPMPIPSAAPLMAPISEITTDSQRTMARTWLRVMPTARSRPSSRVRSKTESARVLTMPSRAIMTASSSITVTNSRRPSMKPLASASKASWSRTLASGWSARAADDGVLDLAQVSTVGDLDQTRGDQLGAGVRVLLLDADHVVVRDPALRVVDAHDLELVLAGRGELRLDGVTELEPLARGGGLGDHDTESSPRSDIEPCDRSIFIRSPAVVGSTEAYGESWPPKRAWPQPLDEIDSTPGTSSTASMTDGLNPGPCALEVVTYRSAFVLSPITSPNDSFSDEAKTLMLTTRVRPIMRAAAVDDVRRGLRIAFCFASSPGMPRSFIGVAMSAASGRTIRGRETITPRSAATSPRPKTFMVTSP